MPSSPHPASFASRTPPAKRPAKVMTLIARATAAMRADDDMAALLDAFASLQPAAIEKCTPAEARQQPTPADAVIELLRVRGQDTAPEAWAPGVRTLDCTLPGDAGDLRARLYIPPGEGPFAVVLYFHGGGWVIADLDVYDASARGLCQHSGAIVLSVDYRRAPEHPFPAAWDDALAAYRWLTRHAAECNGDPQRLALAGESAGGTLAVATAIAARDQKLTPPRHLLAIYPVVQAQNQMTPSYLENALAQPLNRAMMQWFFRNVFAQDAMRRDPRIDLLRADLRGLPRTTLINATLDPLRSDGADLAAALERSGVSVLRKDYAGVGHEFFGAAAVLAKARDAQELAGQRLRGSLIPTGTPRAYR